jgi:S1-C subfamily serine protease
VILPRALTAAVVAVVGVVGPVTSTIPARYDVAPLSGADAATLLGGSTVQVMVFGCDLRRQEGTAVAVGPSRLLTNEHVVRGARVVDLATDDGPTVSDVSVGVAPAGDVATVQAPGLALTPLLLAAADPAPGDPVRLAGFPAQPVGTGLVVESLRVVGWVSAGQPWPVLRLSGPSRPGMSGGPVLDAAGRLAGIVFGNEVQTGQALVIPASVLRSLMQAGRFVPATC